MSRTRVGHLSFGLDMGGLEKLLVEFARHADRDRFDLEFISMTTAGSAGEDIKRLGWSVTALHQRPGVDTTLPLRLAALFRRRKIEVLHTHNTGPLLYGAGAARLAGIERVIHTRHGQRHGATRRQTALFNFAARCADKIVSVSNDSTELAARQGLARDRLTTIHNGVDLSRLASKERRLLNTAGPAVFVGRLSAEKDIPTLLEATEIVIRQAPEFRLHIVGAGPCGDELQLQSSARQLGNHVVFLGQTNNVAAVLAEASLFVLPSLTEGISLALLEAMALGLPVVATRVGGNVEVVNEGSSGFLVPPRAPQLMAEAILRLHRDPDLAITMGVAGRRRVETHFDARQMVAGYESLYLSPRVSAAKAA